MKSHIFSQHTGMARPHYSTHWGIHSRARLYCNVSPFLELQWKKLNSLQLPPHTQTRLITTAHHIAYYVQVNLNHWHTSLWSMSRDENETSVCVCFFGHFQIFINEFISFLCRDPSFEQLNCKYWVWFEARENKKLCSQSSVVKDRVF